MNMENLMAVSEKIKEMMERSSWIRKMFEVGAKLREQYGAENVYDFSLGNPNIDPPDEFKRVLLDLVTESPAGMHAYMPNAGYPEVREEMARFVSEEQQTEVTGNNIIMTVGAGGALNTALKTILNPGNKVLVSTPCFMEYNFYVDNHGGTLELVPGKEDFDLDIKAIGERIDKKTAAVIINSPNNPSGKIYPKSTIKELGILLAEKSREIGRAIYLISDEPYRRLVYDDAVVPPIFPYYRNSIIATSFSKDLSVPGERIGFLAVHKEADDLENLMNGMILCNRILGYVNAPALMQRTVAKLRGISVDPDFYRRKRDKLCDALGKMGYKFIKPKGTFYLFVKAPGGDDLAVVDALQKERILTVPGRGFAKPGYFRISYAVDDWVIEGSLPGFERAIAALR